MVQALRWRQPLHVFGLYSIGIDSNELPTLKKVKGTTKEVILTTIPGAFVAIAGPLMP